MINKIKINKDINFRTAAIIILTFIFMVISISGCSVFTLIEKTYTAEKDEPVIPEVEIDESEINEIERSDENIRKSYDVENEIGIIDESLRDPFRPFYISEEKDEEEEKNILTLEKIYTKDGEEYAELNFNDYTYKLKEADTLADYYYVQAININSVVLLKGDEVITLFIGIPLYD